MSFDFMSFANQQQALGNAYSGIQQQVNQQTQSANDALTRAMKLTQLNFDSAEESAKTLIDGGLEGLGGIEGANMLWKGGKKILQKFRENRQFNKDQEAKLNDELDQQTEDSFKVKVSDEDAGDGLENTNEPDFIDEDGVEYTQIDDAGEDLMNTASDLTGNVSESVGQFGENIASNIDDLASNVGEMGGDIFDSAINSFKNVGQSGIDAMNDLFNGIKGGVKSALGRGGTNTSEIEMTDMTSEGRMPVQEPYDPEVDRGYTNFGEKMNTTADDDGIELTEFQKQEGSLQKEGQNLEQTANDDEKKVNIDENADEDLADGDLEGAEDLDPEIEDVIGDTTEELTGEAIGEGITEAVGGALDWSPLGWIISAIGGIASLTTSAVGVANEIKAHTKEHDALSQAQNAYDQAKAKVANFNPEGQYAIPAMNSLASMGQ